MNMPDWKIHVSFSILLLFLLLKLFSFLNVKLSQTKVVLLVFFCVLSSVFPDIDKANSKIRRFISFTLSLTLVSVLLYFEKFKKWYEVPLLFIFVYFLLKFLPTPHRSILHKNWFCILFTSFFVLAFFVLGFSYVEIFLLSLTIFISYTSHLLLDGVG